MNLRLTYDDLVVSWGMELSLKPSKPANFRVFGRVWHKKAPVTTEPQSAFEFYVPCYSVRGATMDDIALVVRERISLDLRDINRGSIGYEKDHDAFKPFAQQRVAVDG